ASLVWNEPVCRIRCVPFLHKEKLRKVRSLENVPPRELIVFLDASCALIAPLETLKQQPVADHMLIQKIERKQRVAQVVEHAHEDHQIESLRQPPDLVDRHLGKLDIHAGPVGREFRLAQVAGIAVDSDYPSGVAAL